MIKISLKKGIDNNDILIEKYKIFIGENYYEKFNLIQMFRSLNHQKSEYTIENNLEVSLKINDELVSSKAYLFFEISQFFNFDADLKLGTKSLSYHFIMNKLLDDIHFDTINTMNFLLESLQNEINENLENVRISFDEINAKSLFKLSSISLLKDEMMNHSCDLSYEEYIIQQLFLLRDIAEHSLVPLFVIVDIPILTEKILEIITELKNSYFLIFTKEYPEISNIKNIYLMDELNIDFADEQLVYETFGERGGKLLTMQELNRDLIKHLNTRGLRTNRFIKEMLQQ